MKEHTELCWLLCSVTAHGDLNRMHQFKDKSAQQRELTSAGLFLYPVLQAADVLAYRAAEVPVGDDQRQHVELMRDIAERFNSRFGDVLVAPKHVIPEVGARIMDLQDPSRKMSTTGSEERGLIYLDDDEKSILKKVKSAVTDSGSEVRRGPGKEGITNLIDVLAVIRGVGPEAIEAEFEGQQYGAFKGAVAEAVVDYLRPVRERYEELRPDEAGLERGFEGGRGAGARPRLRDAGRRAPRDGRRAAGLVCTRMAVAALDLDLEVFQGPFDLLLTLVLREEVDLLEVELADVVVAYIDHLEQRGELDLEAATEFLVLIAALLELKSRLMLPGEDEEGLDLEPGEAAEELLARMLEYRRYRTAAEFLKERLADEEGHRYRSAPLPPHLRRVSLELAEPVYEPGLLAEAVGGLLALPPKLDLGHVARAHVTVEQRLAHVRELLGRLGSFSFDDAVRGADRLTEAVTLFALLELYKAGEADWDQSEAFGPITISGGPN